MKMSDVGVTIKRYPTTLHVRCPACGHQGHVTAFIDKPPKLRCTKCDFDDPIILTRDGSRTWAAQRSRARSR